MGKRTEFLYLIGKLLTFADENNIPIICTCFFRSAEDQNKAYKEGKSNCDGYRIQSNHQKWLAMDLAILDENGEVIWDSVPGYTMLGEFWEGLGGTWGGRWRILGDIYHFEYKE